MNTFTDPSGSHTQVSRSVFTSAFILVTAALLSLFFARSATADSIGIPAQVPKAYMAECASCHTSYAPGLLPAKSWQSIMGNLDKHYGSDASIDEKSVKEISAWLQSNAATSRKFTEAPPDNRITNSEWFKRKHREVKQEVWLRPSVKSRSNCMACHQQAAKGDFDEDNVRIPR
jgi:mono/diheme cytochrome c family protein